MKRRDNATLDRLASVRAELTAVVAEAQRVSHLPPTAEEVVQRVDTYLAELGETWNPSHRFVNFLQIPTEAERAFRLKPNTHSDGSRTPVPIEAEQ